MTFIIKSLPIRFQRQTFSSVSLLTQNLSRTLIRILFVKWNLINQILKKPIESQGTKLVPVLPKDGIRKLIIRQAVDQLNNIISLTVRSLCTLILISKLLECPVAMTMKVLGTSLDPQFMTKIGNVSHFTHKGAITAFVNLNSALMNLEAMNKKVFQFQNASSK